MTIAEKFLACLIFLLLCAGAGFFSGYRTASNKYAAEQLAQEQAAHARYVAEVERGDQLAAQLEQAKTHTRTVTKTLTREVVNYVSPISNRACAIPLGFVRLHDAAAQNRLPEAAGIDADAPGNVDLAAVAATVADNYGTCNEWRAHLEALIDWHNKENNP